MERHGGFGYELVLSLDALVLQMVDQSVDVFQFFDTFMLGVAEKVFEVPKILEDSIPSRNPLREPQLVEQLVEVPTVPQTVGIPSNKVFFQDRVRQRMAAQFFKVYAQNRVRQLFVELIILVRKISPKIGFTCVCWRRSLWWASSKISRRTEFNSVWERSWWSGCEHFSRVSPP